MRVALAKVFGLKRFQPCQLWHFHLWRHLTTDKLQELVPSVIDHLCFLRGTMVAPQNDIIRQIT